MADLFRNYNLVSSGGVALGLLLCLFVLFCFAVFVFQEKENDVAGNCSFTDLPGNQGLLSDIRGSLLVHVVEKKGLVQPHTGSAQVPDPHHLTRCRINVCLVQLQVHCNDHLHEGQRHHLGLTQAHRW